MAWWNPLTWFTTEAEALDAVSITEEGRELAVQAIKDGTASADKYLFEVQTLLATGEVVYVVPMGEEEKPLSRDDRKAPFVVVEALLTLEQAARLKLLSKYAGGNGLTKTFSEVVVENPPPAPPAPEAASLFSAPALLRAKPDQVRKATIEQEL